MRLIAGTIGLISSLILWNPAEAIDRNIYPGPYRAEIIKVIDGDTIEVRVPTWPGAVQVAAVRVDGLDTPEIRSKCSNLLARKRETVLANEARRFVINFLSGGIVLRNVRLGKFAGRVIAEVENVNGRSLTDALLKAKSNSGDPLAHFYDGGRRKGWC